MLLSVILLFTAASASAFEITEWRLQTSLYTKHWDPDPVHVNKSKMLNLEFTTASQWLYGFAWFDNSFGQPSQYLYAGRQWPLFKQDWAYFKLTGGLLHGYKGDYQDNIALNGLGVAPVIVPTFGLKYKRVLLEFHILGASAGVITAGFNFGQQTRNPE